MPEPPSCAPPACRWLLLAEGCAAPLLSQMCVNLLGQWLLSAAEGDSLLSPMAMMQADYRWVGSPLLPSPPGSTSQAAGGGGRWAEAAARPGGAN